jgi:hypothetical protein
MSAARTAGRLLRCYPRGFRDRYGEELEALIVDMSGGERVPWRVRLDVVAAGAREHLGGGGGARGGLSTVLWAWALFVLGGCAVRKGSEHWHAAGSMPSVAFGVLVGVAVATGLVVLAGIALALPAYLRAGRLTGVRRALVLTVILVGATAGLVAWASGLSGAQLDGSDTAYVVGFLAWTLLAAATLFAWTAAATAAARSVELTPPVLRAERRLAAAAAAGMAIMATATAVWWGTASPVAGPMLVAGAALMAAGTILALAGARQALMTPS